MPRQGDVLIFPGKARKTGVKKLERPVLADGEVTGHAHVAAGAEVYVVDGSAVADEVDRWLRATTPVTVRHEEHAPIVLEPGEYIIRRQVEFDPLLHARMVAD